MSHQVWKRTMLAAAAGLLLGGGILGVAAAQQGSAATPPSGPAAGYQDNHPEFQQQHDDFMAKVAAKLSISADKLKQAFDDTRKELGWSRPDGDHGGAPGQASGPRGPHGPDGDHPGPRGPGGPDDRLTVAATALGISRDDLLKELPGNSLEDLAKQHKVDPKKVSDALKAAASAEVEKMMTRKAPEAGQWHGPGAGH